MKRVLLTFGLLLSSALYYLPLQGQSVAGSTPVASKVGIASAISLAQVPTPKTVVASDHHEEVHHHSHSHSHSITVEDVGPNIGKRVSPRRRIIAKAAASELMVVEQPMVAAIDQSEATMAHKELFNEVLQALPARCRDTLKNLYVRYEKQKSRGLAGKSIMILDGTVKSADELRALFVHETAHNWDLGCLKGTKAAGKSTFSDGDEAIYNDDPSLDFYRISWITSSVQRSDMNPEDFVSGYGSTDIFEDFAESFAYFILHNNEFLDRAQQNEVLAKKYIYLRDVIFEGTVPRLATSNEQFSGRVPWDTTKLNYSWHPSLAITQR